jgi:serine/threonine protein kinase
LAQLLGPYLAPEVRSNGAFGEQSDIYSLGVLLAELLTVREASLSGPPEFLPDDPFSEDVGRLLKTLLAEPAARLRSVRAVRLRLQKLLEDCPYERSNADLALDLDELLMPENGARSSTGTVAARLLRSPHRPRPGSFEPGATSRTWVLRIAASLAAVLLLAAVDLAVRKREPSRAIAPAPQKSFASHLAERPSLPAVSSIGPGEELRDSSLAASPVSAPEVHLSVHRPSRTALRQERHLAQVWRLRAALSRVSAEQIDAADLAAEAFRAGRISENEGERLLAVRRPRQAREAFERAAELYNQAEDLSHQERARVIRISLRNAEGPAPGSF